jgi:hypothetical protein
LLDLFEQYLPMTNSVHWAVLANKIHYSREMAENNFAKRIVSLIGSLSDRIEHPNAVEICQIIRGFAPFLSDENRAKTAVLQAFESVINDIDPEGARPFLPAKYCLLLPIV